jgi:hypothetical protein
MNDASGRDGFFDPGIGYHLQKNSTKMALKKSLISHHYQRSMMNRFSKDIVRGAATVAGAKPPRTL